MGNNTIKEVRKKDVAGLRAELVALRKEQFNLRMAAASGQPARPDQHGKVRRNIPQHPDCKPVLKPPGHAIRPSATELSVNPRARSAIMRVAEKLV